MGTDGHIFYQVWRQRQSAQTLHDGDAAPPEKLLQAIWQHQRLRRSELKTADGRTLRVLHPGFISVEGGPDFRGAVLKLADEPPVTGDVEIDVRSAGWRAHKHETNPNFKGVILHVIWERTETPISQRSTLALKPFLDSSLPDLALALESESGLPENLRGKCAAPLRELETSALDELLQAAGWARFENKATALLAAARNHGWEQALWEGLFKALGYKHNVWPMQAIAESKPVWSQAGLSVEQLQARLLGVSGLLPAELTRNQKNSDTFLRRAWDGWWRDRSALADCTLPRAVWKFHGLRPANHPQRRLALAAHWLASGEIPARLESWCATELSGGRLLKSLGTILAVQRDDFWSWHWTFNSTRFEKPQPLLGESRVTDLAVNVILPWLWVRAREGGNERLMRELERRYLAWPSAQDNSVLKLARQRLLGSSGQSRFATAARQQGLMQIVRDFCRHTNAICADCRFPDLVRSWQAH